MVFYASSDSIGNWLFNSLRSFFSAIMNVFSDEGGSPFFTFLTEHWKVVALVLIVLGILADQLIYILRYRPFHRLAQWLQNPNHRLPDGLRNIWQWIWPSKPAAHNGASLAAPSAPATHAVPVEHHESVLRVATSDMPPPVHHTEHAPTPPPPAEPPHNPLSDTARFRIAAADIPRRSTRVDFVSKQGQGASKSILSGIVDKVWGLFEAQKSAPSAKKRPAKDASSAPQAPAVADQILLGVSKLQHTPKAEADKDLSPKTKADIDEVLARVRTGAQDESAPPPTAPPM